MGRSAGNSNTRIILCVLVSVGILLGGGMNLLKTGLERYWTADHLARQGVAIEGVVQGKRNYLSTFGMLYLVRFTYAPGGAPELAARIEALLQQGYAEDNPLVQTYRQLAGMEGGSRMEGRSQVGRHFFRQVAVGDPVTVHCDPAEPSVALLDLAHHRSLGRLLPGLIGGAVLLLVGVLLLVLVVRLTVSRKRVAPS